MSDGKPDPVSHERPDASRQPDLFDARGRADAGHPPEPPVRSAVLAPASMTDDGLIERLADARPPDIDALCHEIAARSLAAAVSALEALWRRFHGFGIDRPLREQRAVLGTLTRLDGPESRRALRRIVLSPGLPAVPPLATYADLPDWTERHFPGRIVLAGSALRSLKSARFEDVALVGQAVALLGTTYHRMKTEGGMELRDAFEDALRELKLQETPSISPDRQGRARDGFEIEWEGRRLTLDRHLKNNSGTRDPRRCLRIYFAWDEETARVVIGHLPGHMRT
ncbi:MAG: hypothetical protein OXC28_20710 [Defluviicoccus sp.]|nr:hypothetical protein [Defluviicoccus sp.]